MLSRLRSVGPSARSSPMPLIVVTLVVGVGVLTSTAQPTWLFAAAGAFFLFMVASRAPRTIAIALLALLPLIGITRRITGSYLADFDPLTLVAPAVALACLIVAVRRGERILGTPLAAVVTGMVVLGAVQALNPLQGGPVVGIAGAGLFVGPLVWFYLGQALGDASTLRNVNRVVRVVAIAVAAYGVNQTLSGYAGFEQRWIAYRLPNYQSLDIGGTTRPFSTFASNAEYGYFLALGAMLWACRPGSKGLPVRLFVVAGLMAACAYSGARTSLVVGVVGLTLLWFVRRRRSLGAALVSSLIVLVAASASLALVPHTSDGSAAGKLWNRTAGGLSRPFDAEVSTLGLHLTAIRTGVRAGLHAPLGSGAGLVNSAGRKLGGRTQSGDHDLPNILLAYGWIGGVLLLILLVRVYRRVDDTVRLRRQDLLGPALFVLMLFGSWFSGELYAVGALTWFFVGSLDRQLALASTADVPTEGPLAVEADGYHLPVAQDSRTREIDLSDYGRTLWRRKGVIAIAVIVVLGASIAISYFTTPVYAATARVLLGARVVESPFDPSVGVRLDPTRTVANEIEVLASKQVTDAVAGRIGSAPKVSVKSLTGTDVLLITARSTQPTRAAEVANAYANSYIDYRRTRAVDDLLAAGNQIQAKVADLDHQIDAALPSQRELLVQQQSLFKSKLDQLQVDAALKTGGAELVTPAEVPKRPFEPQPLRSAMIAIALGLVLGSALAFLVEFLDDSVKTKEDLDRVAPDLRVIGLIPIIPGWKPNQAKVVSLEDPNSGAAEAYRTLRTALQFIALERPLRALQITSPGAFEGKSSTTANLGVALALAGNRVIIVCCDLRRPRVHEFFNLDNTVGLTSVLLGQVPLSTAVQPVPGQARLSLLASGTLPPNPSELLASTPTAQVLHDLQAHADIVILDCPPVLPVTDALVLSGRVDATLVVSAAGSTTRKNLGRAIELLRQVDAPLVGTVLNGVSESGTYGYAYGYYHNSQRARWRAPEAADRQPVAKR